MIDISIKGINKSYGALQVLKNINLNINQGQILSIVGKSGAGKTTLLQIIGTLDKPDNGTVMLKDIDVSQLKGKKLADFRNKNIGFVFQFHQLLPEFTALENVMFPLLIAGKSEKKARERALEILIYLDLKNRIKHKPNELSGGEQQRVAVARALANNPPIILADEPSGNLDSKNADILHELFAKLCKDLNKTIIIITHNLALANKGHRVIQLEDGEIIADKKGELA